MITITTSGGAKVGKSGLCDKCLSVAREASSRMEEEKSQGAALGRRRHKSAAVRAVSEHMDVSKPKYQDDMSLHVLGGIKSDSSLPRIPSEGLDSTEDLTSSGKGAKGRKKLESRSQKMRAVDEVLMCKCV